MKRMLLGIMAGCLAMTSVTHAQQVPTQHVSNNVTTAYGTSGQEQEQEQYVPYQPQAVYTNTNMQVSDPLALAESAYSQPLTGNGGSEVYPQFYGPQFYGDRNVYGYQPQPCVFPYRPILSCGPWYASLWLDQGFTYNVDEPDDKQNGPWKYTDRSNEYMFNQFYLSLGRKVANFGSRWDVGGKVDLLYGADYLWTSAIGLETHTQHPVYGYQEDPAVLPSKWTKDSSSRQQFGLAMPQLYAEFYVPLHLGLNIKAGHFYSIMGYESVMSPQNFFYSHTYTMMYGQPMTHTGMLLSQRLTNRLTGVFGLTRGWDTWEDPNGKLSYLGGFQWTSPSGLTEFSWVAGTGNETVADKYGGSGNSTPDAIRTNYSMVLSHQLTPRLKLVTQHDMGYEKDGAFERNDRTGDRLVGVHWYSVSQYAFLQLTDKLVFGVRGEWFRDVNSGRIYRDSPVRTYDAGGNLIQQTQGTDYWGLTAGFNWKPFDRLVIRPEARWDWSDVCKVNTDGTPTGVSGMYNNYSSKSQNTYSVSAYVMF